MTRVDKILQYLGRARKPKCLSEIVTGIKATSDEVPMIHGRLFDLCARKVLKRKKVQGKFHYVAI